MNFFFNFQKESTRLFFFTVEAVRYCFRRPFRKVETLKQMEFTAYSSWFVLFISAGFLGMALTIQLYYAFSSFNATSLVGSTVAIIFLKELSPTFTAILLSAQVGGAIVAQIGNMKVSSQIDALEMMSVNPLHYLVGPRVWALLFVSPALCMAFSYVAVWGSYIIGTFLYNLDGAIFWHSISEWVKMKSILEGLIKSVFFGFITAVVCCYKGFTTKGGAEGVGRATNQGVVLSILGVIIANVFLSSILKRFLE